MFNIFASNSYKNCSEYVCRLLSKTDPRNLDCQHIVIVPDRASMSAEQSVLRAIGGSFNVQVLTLRRFAEKILGKHRYFSKQSGIMALTEIALTNKSKLKCFVKGADNTGFVESVYETICNLKYSRILPKDLTNESLPPSLKGKINDIRLLYEGYQEYLDEGYVDSAGKMELLLAQIPLSQTVKNSHFYFFDFDNYSNQEKVVIAALVLNSRSVTLTCCFSDEKKHKYLYLNDIFADAQTIAKQCGVQPFVQIDKSFPDQFREYIGQYLYTYTLPKTPYIVDKDRLRVTQATSIDEEAECLAKYIVQTVRKGAKYGDFYVVTSDLNVYRQSLQRWFGAYEIPLFMDTQVCLGNHPYVRYVIDFFTMAKYNNKLEYVLPVVKNRFFLDEPDEPDAIQTTQVRYADVCDFENYCLKYNVNYDFKQFELGVNDDSYAGADKVRAKLQGMIESAYYPQSNNTVEQYIDQLQLFVKENLTDDKLNGLRSNLLSQSDTVKYAKATEQVTDKLQSVLEQMRMIFVQGSKSLEQFIKILSSGVNSVNISVLPLNYDCVVVTNMAKSRQHAIKRLCLLGANQGAMPIVKHDTALINDSNIKSLNRVGIDLQPMITIENKRERFNVFQLLLEEDTSLYVSYCYGDDESAKPSEFVRQLRNIFAYGTEMLPLFTVDDYDGVFTRKSALDCVVNNRRMLAENKAVKSAYYTILSEKFAKEVEAVYFNEANIPDVKCGQKLFFDSQSTSVSKIEDFYLCPYKHYFGYGLKVRPRQVAQLNPNDLGTILHAVLEKFIRRGTQMQDDQAKTLAKKIFDSEMRQDYYAGILKDLTLRNTLKALRNEAVKMCIVVKKQLENSKFVNYATELGFGTKQSELPPLQITGSRLLLHGVIDRLDVADGKCIIIDYKSGSVKFSEKELFVGRKLQLLVYTQAVKSLLGFQPVGYYYFKLHDNFVDEGQADGAYVYSGRSLNDLEILKKIDTTFETNGMSKLLGVRLVKDGTIKDTPNVLDECQMQAQAEYAIKMILNAQTKMQQGNVMIAPLNNACDFCDYKDICGKNDVFNVTLRSIPNKIDADVIAEVVKNG